MLPILEAKNYFEEDGTQNYLVFQPMPEYFGKTGFGSNIYISAWESKGLSNENIIENENITGFAYPKLIYDNSRTKVKFYGSILKQNKVAFYGPIVNIYTVYRSSPKTNNSSIVLEHCLFGAMNITKIAEVNKYEYRGWGLGFDSKGSCTHRDGGYGKNVITLGADLCNSRHANDKTKNVLVLGGDFVQKR